MSVVPLAGLLGLKTPPLGETKGARFIRVSDLGSLMGEAEALGLLPVLVQPLRPADRGKLALVLEEAIESALERRGACPPGIGATADLDASLGDQLYRARLVEARGLCVFLASLEGAATLSGALDAEDSAVLRWWLEAPRTRPLQLWLDEANRTLGVYGPPLPLARLLDGAPALERESAPHVAPELAQSSETMELSERPPAVRALEPGGAMLATSEPSPAGDLASALVAELTADSVPDDALPPLDETPFTSPVLEDEPLVARGDASVTQAEPSSLVSEPVPPAAPPAVTEEPASGAAGSPVTTAEHGPLHPGAAHEWQSWARELEMARGPKPLAMVERMFAMSYVPLRDAYLRGIAPSEVGPVLEGWATSFASSYREAFAALCVRGKRPTMVLDVPDAAMRIGRLHGARSVQLLLVDGLRFDLGLRVELGLRARLGREVALTERLLLWSALPSDTATQLELIGRGPDGLRELANPRNDEPPVARGRMASTPRRIKAGHRELLKLDLVEARLSEPGVAEAARLDALGVEVTDAVAELCEKLPQRTLLMVFGDHGFCLDPQVEGTGALRQGGSRPEEVLVPAFAWLVGGVQ